MRREGKRLDFVGQCADTIRSRCQLRTNMGWSVLGLVRTGRFGFLLLGWLVLSFRSRVDLCRRSFPLRIGPALAGATVGGLRIRLSWSVAYGSSSWCRGRYVGRERQAVNKLLTGGIGGLGRVGCGSGSRSLGWRWGGLRIISQVSRSCCRLLAASSRTAFGIIASSARFGASCRVFASLANGRHGGWRCMCPSRSFGTLWHRRTGLFSYFLDKERKTKDHTNNCLMCVSCCVFVCCPARQRKDTQVLDLSGEKTGRKRSAERRVYV